MPDILNKTERKMTTIDVGIDELEMRAQRELMALNIENARMYFELIDELKMGSFSIKKVSGGGKNVAETG